VTQTFLNLAYCPGVKPQISLYPLYVTHMEKKRPISLALCMFSGAALVAVYGAGFSWRQVLFGVVSIFLWMLGNELWDRAFAAQPFNRIQFRLELSHLERAIEKAGIYSEEEIESAAYRIEEEITGNGRIVFTWLEPSLFYVNTTSFFCSTLSLNLSVPSFGGRGEKVRSDLPDLLEIRTGNDSYELVFLTSEQQYCWPESTSDKGLVLFRLPYKFMRALQTVGEPWEANKAAHAVLAGEPDLKYHELPEIPNGWDYVGNYVNLKWWPL
jgi:hypothetical protein